MAQVLVNIRMDEELKKSLESVCNELGMNITTAFTIFAKKMSREKRIPFEVSVDPFYSAENIAELESRVESIRNGTSTLKEHDLIEADPFHSKTNFQAISESISQLSQNKTVERSIEELEDMEEA